MTRRKCPACGESWFSSDTMETWKCGRCGAPIEPKEEIPLPPNDTI